MSSLLSADVESLLIRTFDGKTLLHTACYHGNFEIVKYLVNDKIIEVDVVDFKGRTPLFFARMRKRKEVCEWLMKKGGC